MKIEPERVELKNSTFWNALEIYYKKSDFYKVPFSSLIKEIISENQVNENTIIEFKCEEVQFYNQPIMMQIRLKYLTIDLEELHSKSEKEQIRIVLEKLGYTDEHVRKIEQRKFDNTNELYWHAEIYHDSFNYDPDETLSQRDFENHLYEQLHAVLEFKLIIN